MWLSGHCAGGGGCGNAAKPEADEAVRVWLTTRAVRRPFYSSTHGGDAVTVMGTRPTAGSPSLCTRERWLSDRYRLGTMGALGLLPQMASFLWRETDLALQALLRNHRVTWQAVPRVPEALSGGRGPRGPCLLSSVSWAVSRLHSCSPVLQPEMSVCCFLSFCRSFKHGVIESNYL